MTDLSAGFLQVLRAECEQSFAFFARYFFKARKGSKFQLSGHHEQIVRDLEDLFYGRVQNLIINCPPRYSKTELCIVLFVAWCYARNPQCEFMHLSYSSTLAMVNSDAIREVLKSKEFQQLWPDLAIKPNADSKQAWDTTGGGRFYAQHAGGAEQSSVCKCPAACSRRGAGCRSLRFGRAADCHHRISPGSVFASARC